MQEKNFIRRGSRLANDATVLKISEYDNEQGKAYALCVFRNDFVTWELVRDNINSAVHGHYFFDLQMALDSFEARCIDRGAVKPLHPYIKAYVSLYQSRPHETGGS